MKSKYLIKIVKNVLMWLVFTSVIIFMIYLFIICGIDVLYIIGVLS